MKTGGPIRKTRRNSFGSGPLQSGYGKTAPVPYHGGSRLRVLGTKDFKRQSEPDQPIETLNGRREIRFDRIGLADLSPCQQLA